MADCKCTTALDNFGTELAHMIGSLLRCSYPVLLKAFGEENV